MSKGTEAWPVLTAQNIGAVWSTGEQVQEAWKEERLLAASSERWKEGKEGEYRSGRKNNDQILGKKPEGTPSW